MSDFALSVGFNSEYTTKISKKRIKYGTMDKLICYKP